MHDTLGNSRRHHRSSNEVAVEVHRKACMQEHDFGFGDIECTGSDSLTRYLQHRAVHRVIEETRFTD